MYIVIITSLIALFLTYLDSCGRMRNGMKIGFILVTILGAIHYDYGNDYMPYLNLYNEVTSYQFSLANILNGLYYREPGWVLLCWLFKPIGGFYMMVAVLNIIQNYIVYKFIKSNVDSNWWWFAIFIYLFSTSFYLMSFSMMRQEFVMIVFLGLWKYIRERKWLIPTIVLLCCSFIHSSSIILLPFVFWGFIPSNGVKPLGVVYVILLLLLWFFRDVLDSIFEFFTMTDDSLMDYVDTYEDDANKVLKLGLGFIINMIPFVLSVLFILRKDKDSSNEMKKLVALSAISFMVAPFAQIIQLAGRIGIYFGIFSIGSVPLIYSKVKNNIMRYGLTSLYLFIVLFDYIRFFRSEVWADKYTEFNTIFPQIF